MKKQELKNSSRISELIANGSTTDRVVTLLLEWTDALNRGEEPTISDAERRDIEGSLTRSDWKIYFIYLTLYRSFVRYCTRLALAKAIYEKNANGLIGDFNMIQAEELLLTDLLQKYTRANTHFEKDLEAQLLLNATPRKVVVVYGYKGERVFYRTGEGVDWWKNILEGIEIVKGDYRTYVEMIKAVEIYSRKKKRAYKKEGIEPARVIPPIVKRILRAGKEDYSKDIAPALSKTILERRIKKGEKVSDEERARAIFPRYNDIKTTSDGVKYWVEELESYFDDIKTEIYESARK